MPGSNRAARTGPQPTIKAKESAISTSAPAGVQPEIRWTSLNWVHILWWAMIQGGCILAPFTFSWSGLALCGVLYCVTALGITVGYHRLLSHRSFRPPRIVEYLLTIMATLANQGGPLQWVAVHRTHHRHSDQDGDPHSPRDSFWWAHILWWMPYIPNLDTPEYYQRYVPDLAKDPVQRLFQKVNALFPILLAVGLYIGGEIYGGLGLSWLVWGVFVRTAALYHATWFVNSAAHVWGYRTYNTRDTSTNLWWVALLTMGEGWHNNHHAFPRSARHGLRWWEVDPTYLFIQFLAMMGLAKQIHTPPKAARKAAAARTEPIFDIGEPAMPERVELGHEA